jgi:hypothetical protein
VKKVKNVLRLIFFGGSENKGRGGGGEFQTRPNII